MVEPHIWPGRSGEPSGDKEQDYVDQFIGFAKEHAEYVFLVTEIGCGIAGFAPKEIAPLFKEAMHVPNIHLPQRFWDVLNAM